MNTKNKKKTVPLFPCGALPSFQQSAGLGIKSEGVFVPATFVTIFAYVICKRMGENV